MRDRHLISVDELRAAGALDVPPEWRKSLSAGLPKHEERNLFSGMAWDDDESQAAASGESASDDGEESGDGSD